MKFLEPFCEVADLNLRFFEVRCENWPADSTPYEAYFDRVVKHKIEVYKAGMELPIQDNLKRRFQYLLEIHDLSKFSVNEAPGYANHDFKSKEFDLEFEKAWHHHKMVNPHHPEYWLNPGRDGKCEPIPMPEIYVWEMVADWIGAGKTYGSTLEAWLPDNLPKFLFHELTALKLQEILDKIGIETLVADGRLHVHKH